MDHSRCPDPLDGPSTGFRVPCDSLPYWPNPRLSDEETEALQRRFELLGQVLYEELPKYAEVLERLGQ